MIDLVTGGTGFIGRHLARHLTAQGRGVRVLAQTNTDKEQRNAEQLEEAGVEVVLGSVTDESLVAEAVAGVDRVYHLAAAQHESDVPDQHYWDVNVHGTRRLLERAIEAGASRFLYASSIGVYGTVGREVISNDTTPQPDDRYGITKLQAERDVLGASDRIHACAVRISETYGPGDHRLIKLFEGVKRGRFPMIGGGRNVHQPIYVDDLVSGLTAFLDAHRGNGEMVILAGPEHLTSRDMAGIVAEEYGVKPTMLNVPMAPVYAAGYVMEKLLPPLGISPPIHRRRLGFFLKSFRFDLAGPKALFGFEPTVDFREGVRRTAQWYREQGLVT